MTDSQTAPDTSIDTSAAPGQYKSSTRLRNLFIHPLTRALGALALVVALGFIFHADGAFRQWGTHRDMLRQLSVYGILACGMTLVIISGGIDLAVGSVLALGAVIFARLCIHWQWSAPTAIAATLGCGLAAGLVSGGLIARFRIQAFIATLAMMVFARGLSKTLSGGQKISTAVVQPDGVYKYVEAPPIFDLLNSRVFHDQVAVVTLVFLVVLAITWVLLSKLRWGRYVYAVGGNEEASRLSGVPVGGTKLLCYGLSGLFAAIAGICQAAQEVQGDPEAGVGYELTAIAMVVIGGTSLAGGRGGVGLMLVGALTIGYLEKVLSINAVPEATRLMLTGAIIVGAVLFQRTRRS
ncbi:MAG: ABC transporter permease [Candidatus Sumerlaeaceae bacterium]